MSSSACECAPGPCVCGSSHHSETEYPLCVSSPSALKTALMRPIGYERPAPGDRKIPFRSLELSWKLMRFHRPLFKSVYESRLLLEECGKPLLQLLWRPILLAGGDEPDVAERVFQFAGAVSVELIFYRLQYFRPGVVSLADHRVRVIDVKMNCHRSSAQR